MENGRDHDDSDSGQFEEGANADDGTSKYV